MPIIRKPVKPFEVYNLPYNKKSVQASRQEKKATKSKKVKLKLQKPQLKKVRTLSGIMFSVRKTRPETQLMATTENSKKLTSFS